MGNKKSGNPVDAAVKIADLLGALSAANIHFKDISTRQSSLEDIFVSLVGGQK